MINVSSINWRRWVATFCVALLTLVMVERSFGNGCCQAKLDQHGQAQTMITLLNASTTGGADDPAPAQGEEHHCCAAHLAGIQTAQAGALFLEKLKAGVQPAADGVIVPTEQNGQERPPRTTAIA